MFVLAALLAGIGAALLIALVREPRHDRPASEAATNLAV
jgi:hypothetical protein